MPPTPRPHGGCAEALRSPPPHPTSKNLSALCASVHGDNEEAEAALAQPAVLGAAVQSEPAVTGEASLHSP